MSRTFISYQPKQSEANQAIVSRLHSLAAEHTRFGVWQFHRLLRREGFVINHKRTERLYRQEKLSLRLKRRRKFKSKGTGLPPEIRKPNDLWSMDFIHDSTATGRPFRVLSVLDVFSRTCLELEADFSLTAERVVRTLDILKAERGLPKAIRMDNGPEFSGRSLHQWAEENKVRLVFSRPGKPTDNAHVESFQGKFRYECLSANIFTNIQEAKQIIAQYRNTYNQFRPHRSLRGMTPDEFVAAHSKPPQPISLTLSVV